MKLSEMRTAQRVHDDDYRTSPDYRAEWDRAAFAHAVALAVLTYRTERGMSQRDLAKAAGLTQPVIARLEAGDQPPSIATLAKLTAAKGLRLHLDVVDGKVAVSASSGRSTARKAPAVKTTKKATSSVARKTSARSGLRQTKVKKTKQPDRAGEKVSAA
jgi:transcriptional regulator with XRE-family HTH domain